MEKNILILLNGVPKVNFTVNKNNTIAEVKNVLKQFPYDKVTFFVNKETQMPVFDTTKYDKTSLESVWKQMSNPEIRLVKNEKEKKNIMNIQKQTEEGYTGLKKLNKDELIHLITILERDIRREYEKYSIPPHAQELYHKIRKLFKDDINVKPISNSNRINMFISTNGYILELNPITLKPEINEFHLQNAFIFDNLSPNIDTVLAENIKQVIAINQTENKAITDSVLYSSYDDINNKRNVLVLRMFPEGNKVTVKDMLEIVLRVRRDKNGNEDIETFRYFKSHIDENGTLFLQVKFDYYSRHNDEDIDTSDGEQEEEEEEE